MSDVWEIERTSPGNLLWLCGHEKCLYVIIVDSYRYLQTKCFWFISGVSIQPMTQFTTISLFKYFVNIWIKLLAQIWTKLESTQTEVERRWAKNKYFLVTMYGKKKYYCKTQKKKCFNKWPKTIFLFILNVWTILTFVNRKKWINKIWSALGQMDKREMKMIIKTFMK